MSNVPCRMSQVLDQLTRRPNWVSWSFGQVHWTFDMGRLTFAISDEDARATALPVFGKGDSREAFSLRAAARRAAIQTLIAGAITDHQRAALKTDWGVAVFDIHQSALL